MKRMHGPSLLLGLGVGLVLAALLGILLAPLLSPSLSDAAIVERAAKLGMSMQPKTDVEGITMLDDGRCRIDLPEAIRMTELAERLKRAGILDDTLAFEILARKEELPLTLAAGQYMLPPGAGAQEAVAALHAALETTPDAE